MAEVWAHPQLQARERWREVDSPAGSLAALLPPGVDNPRMDAVPGMGQHTAAILKELGLTDADVDRLRQQGAI